MPKFYSQIDASGVPIAGLVLETLASAPSSPTNGRAYYDTALNKARVYQNGAWINFADGAVQSVNGKTGAVVLTKSDVGLSNVDNTSDASKPISTATQTALNAKANLSSPALSGSPTTPTPTIDNGIANKSYVDMAVQGLSAKNSVRVATVSNITLGSRQIHDGISLAPGDRVLVKNQTNPSENGIYNVVDMNPWTRSSDFDSSAEIQAGAYVFVEEGGTNADTGWVLTTDGTITIGTTALQFTQFSGAGQIVAGTGLSKTGNTLSAKIDGTTIDTNGSGNLEVADGAITGGKLASGAIELDGPAIDSNTYLPVSRGGTGTDNIKNAREILSVPGTYGRLVSGSLSAGVWTEIFPEATVNSESSFGQPTVTFMIDPGNNTTEVIYLDWRVGSAGNIEAKSDIDIPGGALLASFIA